MIYTHPAWQELALFLAETGGASLRLEWCNSFDAKVLAAYATAADTETFYRTTDVYLYQNLGFFLDGYKRPYYGVFWQLAGSDALTILDYGCGAGYDGELFLQAGMTVSFADVSSRSLEFLEWRLQGHGYCVPVYALERMADTALAVPMHDIVWCIDVLEHMPQPSHRDFLLQLEHLGRTVIVTLVDDKAADSTVHFPVDVEALTAFVRQRRRCWWQDYHVQPNGNRVRLLVIGERANRLEPSDIMKG